MVYHWMEQDPQFRDAVEAAEATAITTAEATLWVAIRSGDVKAAQWWLERRVPDYRPPARMANAPEIDDYQLVISVVPSSEPA
ncbi:MAG: hypothetical protein KatS3mg017_0838 [Fimbriimonadales bacterium]|nr:MAG: hypothetical protein KatS3mg017_0838 [Fimbriimonadales bacterium]